jgi:hypothetical protein
MNEMLNMYLMQGFEISQDNPTNWVLEKKGKQSVGVHIALLIFTMGIGNIIYFIVKNNDKKRVVLEKKKESN